MEVRDLDQCSSDELAGTIGQLHAVLCATERQLLAVVAAYDRREAWRADGATSMAAWLAYRLGVSHRTGADWARTATALESLPALAGAFGEGRLSHDQVSPLAQVATADTDETLASEAPGWSASQCSALARRARKVSARDAADAHRRRSLRWHWDLDGAMLHLAGRLPADTGARVVSALEHIAGEAKPDPVSGVFEPYEARAADALVELASGYLGAQASPDRATVVIHADVATLAGGEGVVEIDGGPALDLDALRRQSCDCRAEVVAHGPDGALVGVGRARRTVPPWLNRAMRRRDGGCRFPGCEWRRWVHGHHLHHWADGGPTDMGKHGPPVPLPS